MPAHHVRRRLIAAAATTAGVAALAAPAGASGASLQVNRPCYDIVNGAGTPMVITGAGFYPGDTFDVTSSDGSVAAPVVVDSGGGFTTTVDAPTPIFLGPGQKSVTLSADDFTPTGAQITATSSPFLVAPLAVATNPRSVKLGHKVTWSFSGFSPGRLIYGHFLHGRRPHQIARESFGRAHGPCGTLKVRRRIFPSIHPRYDRYAVQVDDSRRYIGQRAFPRVTGTVSILRFLALGAGF